MIRKTAGGLLLIEYRVTKYDPQFRNKEGAYLRKEWTSFSDVGRNFNGIVLTIDEYEKWEIAYVRVALSFLRESNIGKLKVTDLEIKGGFDASVNEGCWLSIDDIGSVIQRLLREEFWCRLEEPTAFVHIGWDYYMYLGVSHPCPNSIAPATSLGLFVEPFSSPYHRK